MLPTTNGLANDSVDSVYRKAIQNYQLGPIRELIDKVSNVDLTAPDGRTALMVAARKGETALVAQLMTKGASVTRTNNNGGSPLMYAVIPGHVDLVERLIEAGADVNATGSNGWGALMIAAAKGHGTIAQYLLKAGADPQAVDIYAWTPLMRASYEGRDDVVGILLRSQSSAIVALTDDQGATALHHAAAQQHVTIARMLIEAGARIHRKDHDGLTPMDYARQNNDVRMIQVLSSAISK